MRLIPLAPLVLAVFPVLAAAQTQPSTQTLSTRLLPPTRVGDFRLAGQNQLQRRSGGQMVYRSPDGVEITANLHPVPALANCTDGCDSVTVDLAANALAASPMQLAGGVAADSLEVVQDEVVGAPYAGRVAYGRRLVASWLSDGRRMRADLSLYALGSYVVEVRSTFRPGPRRDGLPARFGREFVEALGRTAGDAAPACASGPADPEVIKVTEPSRLGIDELRRRVAPVLTGFGFRLDPKVKDRDVWQSVPFEEWPSGIDYGPWAKQASPGFVVAVRLEESAGTARVTVSAAARCAPVSPHDEPVSLELALELLTAKNVLAELEGKRTP